MSGNIFKRDRRYIIPFIITGVVLIIAIIGVTIYGRLKKPETPEVFEPVEITNEIVTIPPEDPYIAEPEPETLTPDTADIADITNENISDYVESVIEGSDLKYLLSTMDDTYAYLITSESINRMESVVVGDYVATAYVDNDGMYISRMTIDSVTGNRHDEIFLNFGHTIDGMTSVRWDKETRAFYTSGTLRLADIAKIIYDPETGKRYKDVFVKMFVPWDHRRAFMDDDQFYVRRLLSAEDGSLLGFVFEQTAIQFVDETSAKEGNIVDGSMDAINPEINIHENIIIESESNNAGGEE